MTNIMNQKSIVACIYLKDGIAVKSFSDHTPAEDLFETVHWYNDCGIDKILLFDLSEDDLEHEKNLHLMKQINKISEIPIYAGGNINRLEDIKKILYTGCKKAILNSLKPVSTELAQEGAMRFGKEKIAMSLFNVDILFKQKELIEENISELVLLNPKLTGTMENVTEIPYLAVVDPVDPKLAIEILSAEESILGLASDAFSFIGADIAGLKETLAKAGISTGRLTSNLSWDTFKLNADGLIPVIVQDYRTNEVLMLAYMNQEAFETTLAIGKMTYWSRSRKELWTKGMTSGHVQYVKSLTLDCDNDTILAKVSQIGAACHTGNPTCFFKELVKEEYQEKNPLKVFENEFQIIKDRKDHPKEGSYTNYLFDKGIDKILKKVGEEATEIVIAAKNPDPEEIKYEIADFLYHVMVLMVEKGLSWEDVVEELSQR